MKLEKIIRAKEDSHTFLHRSTLKYRNAMGRSKYYDVVARRPIKEPEDLNGYVSGVMMVVSDPLDRVLITREFRLAVNQELFGIPSGMVDHGESLTDAASREVLEECGIKDVDWELVLPPVYINPCMTTEQIAICYGRIAEIQAPLPSKDPNEEITSFWCNKSDLPMLLSHVEKFSVASLYALTHYMLNSEKQ